MDSVRAIRSAGHMAARGLSVALISIVGFMGELPSALAANAYLDVKTIALPPSVTLTRTFASTSYAAYRVDVVNNTGNTTNAVVTSHHVSSDSPAALVFKEWKTAAGVTCTPPNLAGDLVCTFGQMKAGASLSAIVIFQAPVSGSQIAFTTGATYSTAGSAGSTPSGVIVENPSVATALVDPATNPSVNIEALTYVPTNGTTICTGVDCTPGTYAGTVSLKLRSPTAGDGTAQLKFVLGAQTAPADCAGFACNSAAVTAPGIFNTADTFLEITLRRGAAFIAAGAKIGKSPIKYTFDNGTTVDITGNFCPGYGTATVSPPSVSDANAASVSPCIAFMTAYPKNYKPNPALSGTFEWIIYSPHNGRFDM